MEARTAPPYLCVPQTSKRRTVPKSLKVVVAVVVAAAAVLLALAAATSPTRLDPAGLALWIGTAIVASVAPVRMPRGLMISVSIAPIVASGILGGPLAAGLVAAIGTLELRELRGRVPWYGTLYNHAATTIPGIAAAFAFDALWRGPFVPSVVTLAWALVAAFVYFLGNTALTSIAIGLRDGLSPARLFRADLQTLGPSAVGLGSLAWLMALAYPVLGAWVALPFALPLYTTRAAYHMVVEIRDMFTQTVQSLASAIDARDPSTQNHSKHVSEIGVDIGTVMGCSEAELEQLQWGGLLHDIGKIGIRDNVLLKEGALTRDEQMKMKEHPVKGEEIIRPVKKLAPELPLIRHHHEWFNGSGYPDGLAGFQIPRLARVLHVADAFEAMTASRPYRKTPLSTAQAIAELRKFAGVQFDPEVVEAFLKTRWARESRAPAQPVEPRVIPVLAQVATARAAAARDAALVGACSTEPGHRSTDSVAEPPAASA